MILDDKVPTPEGKMRVLAYDTVGGELLWESEWFCNLVTTIGKDYLAQRAGGLSGVGAIAGIIFGNGTTAPAVGDTGPSGTTTYYQAIDSGFPTFSGTTATYQVTIANANGNGSGTFQQTEFLLTNSTSTTLGGTAANTAAGVAITHLVVSGGFAKSSSVALVYQYQLTQA